MMSRHQVAIAISGIWSISNLVPIVIAFPAITDCCRRTGNINLRGNITNENLICRKEFSHGLWIVGECTFRQKWSTGPIKTCIFSWNVISEIKWPILVKNNIHTHIYTYIYINIYIYIYVTWTTIIQSCFDVSVLPYDKMSEDIVDIMALDDVF